MTSELLQVFFITHISTELILLFNPIKKVYYIEIKPT